MEPKSSSDGGGARRPAPAKAWDSRPRIPVRKKGMLEFGPDVSEDGSSSSSSSWGASGVKAGGKNGRRRKAAKPVKIVQEGDGEVVALPALVPEIDRRRCGWITAYSEPIFVYFHDEEWGVPVYDDQKLFELFTLSVALSEFSWPAILNKREKFRRLLDNFDPTSVAKFTEKKILSLKSSGGLLSEHKLRAVVENARQMLKVTGEFGSFSNYCWGFVSHKSIVNGFRYARQVPVKSPKSEIISKDLMRRGFRCVGPTIVYSFMQAAGIVNDHLSSCFRFRDCRGSFQTQLTVKADATSLGNALNQACTVQA